MAGEATIGALRVVLGADIAKFEDSLKKADKSLLSLGKAGAAAGAAAAAGFALISAGILKTIDDMDKLGKSAQKIGIPVEELSKLRFAAELSDVSMEQLTTSVSKLSRSMSEIAGGKTTGAAAEAFTALGIKVTDAGGRLKQTDQILLEIAAKFETFRDGAAKTALAVALFGKSGAELIPLLNQGAEGIGKLTKRAEDLGIVIDTKTAKAAEEFNDNMKTLGTLTNAAYINITAYLAPGLATLTQKLIDVRIEANQTSTSKLWELLAKAGRVLFPLTTAAVDLFSASMKKAKQEAEDLQAEIDTWSVGAKAKPKLDAPVLVDPELLKKQREEALAAMKAIEEEQLAIMERFRTPAETMAADVQKINDAYARGILTTEQYGLITDRMMQRVGESVASSAADIAGSISGLLGTFSKENKTLGIASKAFAVSQAIINTYLGATKALASLPPPAGQIAAAATIAAGLASVAKIVAQPGFATGGSFRVGGVGGTDSKLVQFMATPGEMVDVRRPGTTGQTAEITVNGIRPRDFFTGDMLREMVNSINGAHADGYKLKFAES